MAKAIMPTGEYTPQVGDTLKEAVSRPDPDNPGQFLPPRTFTITAVTVLFELGKINGTTTARVVGYEVIGTLA